MEIDKKKLEEFIVRHTCQHYVKNGECMDECTKDKWQRCRLDAWTKEETCAPDCPHFKERPLRGCSFGKCEYVKKMIKKLL